MIYCTLFSCFSSLAFHFGNHLFKISLRFLTYVNIASSLVPHFLFGFVSYSSKFSDFYFYCFQYILLSSTILIMFLKYCFYNFSLLMNSPWLLVTFHFKFKSVLCSLFSLNLTIIHFLCDLDPTVPWGKNAFLLILLFFFCSWLPFI